MWNKIGRLTLVTLISVLIVAAVIIYAWCSMYLLNADLTIHLTIVAIFALALLNLTYNYLKGTLLKQE